MFMLGGFASGLLVYWIANNTITFSQQYIIMRSHGYKPDLFGNIPLQLPAEEALRGQMTWHLAQIWRHSRSRGIGAETAGACGPAHRPPPCRWTAPGAVLEEGGGGRRRLASLPQLPARRQGGIADGV